MNAKLHFVTAAEVSSDLLAAAIAAGPEPMALVEGGVLVYANPVFARVFGHNSALDLCGRRLSEFVPGERACTRPRSLATVPRQSCGYRSCDFTSRRSDGTPLRLQATCAPFVFSGRDLLVIQLRDIAHGERRRLVRESDERFRAVVDEAPIGILQCTMNGHIVESNPAALKLLGYDGRELRGMRFHDLIHAGDLETGSALFEELLSGKEHCRRELRYKRKDEAWGWARVAVSLVRGPDSKPEFIIVMIEDVTEYKRAEQQLRESQKLEAIGRLVGGVAHDFNNLLTGVMLYSDLIRAGLDPHSRLQTYIDEIRMASDHGAALIQQLLALGRNQVLEPRLLSLNESVNSMKNLLSRLIGEHISLETDLDADLLHVRMDPTQVQQVLLNLVINARDALPDGGTILVCTRNIQTEKSEDPQQVELSIEDNGCGMDAETLSHVFEPFFTTKALDHGNGLGLTTVHGIVRDNGGTIRITSEPFKGTRVTVQFVAMDARSAALPLETHSPRAVRETIMLVEDNEAVRDAACRILRGCGYRVLEASNAKDAVYLFESHCDDINLLLTDITLPGSSGRELARKIHQLRPSLPVIFTSGFEKASETSDLVIFRKPFAGEALARRIREVLISASARNSNLDQQKRKCL